MWKFRSHILPGEIAQMLSFGLWALSEHHREMPLCPDRQTDNRQTDSSCLLSQIFTPLKTRACDGSQTHTEAQRDFRLAHTSWVSPFSRISCLFPIHIQMFSLFKVITLSTFSKISPTGKQCLYWLEFLKWLSLILHSVCGRHLDVPGLAESRTYLICFFKF